MGFGRTQGPRQAGKDTGEISEAIEQHLIGLGVVLLKDSSGLADSSVSRSCCASALFEARSRKRPEGKR